MSLAAYEDDNDDDDDDDAVVWIDDTNTTEIPVPFWGVAAETHENIGKFDEDEDEDEDDEDALDLNTSCGSEEGEIEGQFEADRRSDESQDSEEERMLRETIRLSIPSVQESSPPKVGDVVLSIPRLPEIPAVLGRRKRKTALEKWVDKVTALKKEHLAKVETETARVNKEYTTEKEAQETKYEMRLEELMTEYAKKTEELETDNAEKQEVLEELYKDRLEKLEGLSDWTDEVDDQLEDAMDQIEHLKLLLEEADKPKTKNHNGKGKQPQRKQGLSTLIRCPISGNIMVDPVVAADGHTYERSAIQEIFDKIPGGRVVLSPVTNEPLTHRLLTPNAAVKAASSQYT
mmetsp:Transcript_33478/g.77166  ORF Transcript_33478/g.77166 Transcript_33478/m.77166 type:complete len:346 (+) Transcript_33478:81-1118(+)